METNDTFFLLLFWGVWLLIPIVVDGGSTLWHLWLAFYARRQPELAPLPEENLPRVSVVIPAYNEQIDINHCLLSLRAQTYPQHLLKIIVVDDGSQDKTTDVVMHHIDNVDTPFLRTNSFTVVPQHLDNVINLVQRPRDAYTQHGKAVATNAGLELAKGELVVCLDSDVVLDAHAIEQAVRVFLADDKLVAATGHLIIDSDLVMEVDEEGQPRVDADGRFVPKQLSSKEKLLTACQFLEYVTGFHLGRRSEGLIDSMFTISGACAVFRSEVFNAYGKYRARTVSEDTDMTMSLHNVPNTHIGYLPDMHVHLAPVLTWAELYAQRTRWQRGALEVSSLYLNQKKTNTKWMFWNVALPLRLQVDHTLAFPRLMWFFMIWLLTMFGYSWVTIAQVFGLLSLFYLLINVVRTLVAYLFSAPTEKIFIRYFIAYILFLPLYNTFLFWVRVSAEVRTLTENAQWTVETPLLDKIEALNFRKTLRSIAILFHR